MKKLSIDVYQWITNPQRFPIVLILSGILLRISGFYQWELGFDQVQIIDAVQKISSGDLTLIGPATGPADLFTGPLIYYLTSLFWLMGFHYYSLIVTTIFIASLSGWSIYWLSKRYLNYSASLVSLTIWAFSIILIQLDQVTWNPNLTILAAALVFYPVLGLIKNKFLTKTDYFLVFMGGFLSYQAHFSGLLLIPLILTGFLSKKYLKTIAAFLSGLLGLALSLLPTVIFDLRHNWLNTHGLWKFINQANQLGAAEDPYFIHLWRSLYTSYELLGSLIFANFEIHIRVIFALGIFLFIIYLLKSRVPKQHKRTAWLVGLWVGTVILIFSFYFGAKPTYYYLILVPPMLCLYSRLLMTLTSQCVRHTLQILFASLAMISVGENMIRDNPFSIYNGLKLKSYILSQNIPNYNVKYHVADEKTFGLRHLLQPADIDQPAQSIFYVSYPDKVSFVEIKIGQMSVWQEQVANNRHVLFENEFRINTPNEIKIYHNKYYQGDANKAYDVFKANQKVGQLELYDVYHFEKIFDANASAVPRSWTKQSDGSYLLFYPPALTVFKLSISTGAFHEIQDLQIY